MRIAVIGAGGVGGYFGGRLAAAGSNVAFVARGAHRDAIRADGLRIVSPHGDAVVPVRAVDDPAEIGPVDVVIVAVKLWDTEAALARIGPLLGPNTAVISLQNGVAKDELLRAAVGPEHVVGGLCYIAAVIERPGVIRQTGTLQRMTVGEYGAPGSARLEAFAAACTAAGIEIAIAPDIERALWEKFVFLVGHSGSTCAIRQPVGVIRADPRARALLHALFRETVAVGRARGVNVDPGYADDRLAFADALPGAMTSSMHGDLERGNRLELPWLQGAVVEMGRATNVPTPANAFVLDVLSVYAGGAPVLA
jgi:2-dehydropantoate 2-reductase